MLKEDNNWKLLIDRKMVDNVIGEIIEGRPDEPSTLDVVHHCLVCTIVQDIGKSEGYVFQNIENVIVGHGLPGTKSGMPEPSKDDTYTVAQLYRTVKRIPRKDGGLKYSAAEQSKYGFAYTMRSDGVYYQYMASNETDNSTANCYKCYR